MSDNFFLDIAKSVDDEFDVEIPGTQFIDTGCYALNALLSGSIYGGFPSNRVTALAGAEATGKSFFALSGVKTFLDDNPNGAVFYFDSEYAMDKEFLRKRGIPPERCLLIKVETLQDFRTKALNVIAKYEEQEESKRPPMMFVLDSLGNLPTNKEVKDATEGNDIRDMTKAQIIRSIFRTLTVKLGKLQIPCLVTAHTYDAVGAYVPTKVVSGGGGLKYAASTILMLSKKKDKDGNDVVGNILKVKTDKSRFSKEQQTVELKLSFKTGLDRYYGLLPLAEKYNIIKKVSTRYELPDGTKVWGKDINEDPKKYFDPLLSLLDEAARKEYSLGEGEDVTDDEISEMAEEADVETSDND